MNLLRQPMTHRQLNRGLVFAGSTGFSIPARAVRPQADLAVASTAPTGVSRFVRVLHGSKFCLSKPLNTTQQIGGVL
jgi:ketol-acid reductoisomerase